MDPELFIGKNSSFFKEFRSLRNDSLRLISAKKGHIRDSEWSGDSCSKKLWERHNSIEPFKTPFFLLLFCLQNCHFAHLSGKRSQDWWGCQPRQREIGWINGKNDIYSWRRQKGLINEANWSNNNNEEDNAEFKGQQFIVSMQIKISCVRQFHLQHFAILCWFSNTSKSFLLWLEQHQQLSRMSNRQTGTRVEVLSFFTLFTFSFEKSWKNQL